MKGGFWKLEEFNWYKLIMEINYLYFINNSDLEERSHLINLPLVIKLRQEFCIISHSQ